MLLHLLCISFMAALIDTCSVSLHAQMFVSTAAVGSIVGLQSAEIQQMAMEYEEKVTVGEDLRSKVKLTSVPYSELTWCLVRLQIRCWGLRPTRGWWLLCRNR